MKILVLKFQDANIFDNWERSKDRVVVSVAPYVSARRGDISDSKMPFLPDTLYVRHVANVLHVLLGRRPVPKYRRSIASFDKEIYDMAANSFVEIERISEETIITRKSFHGANSKSKLFLTVNGEEKSFMGGDMYPSRFKRAVGEEVYNEFIRLATEYNNGNVPSIKRGMEILIENKSQGNVVSFLEFLLQKKSISLFNLISDNGLSTMWGDNRHNSGKFVSLATNKGVDKIKRISGFIYIPVSDNELNMFKHGNGVATLFDGGMVSIYSIEDSYGMILYRSKKTVKDEVKYVPN